MKQLKLALVFVLTAVMLLGCGTVAFAEGVTGTAQAPVWTRPSQSRSQWKTA